MPKKIDGLVLAEVHVMCRQSTKRILEIASAAVAAQIEPLLLIDIDAELLILHVVQILQNILYLLQMISIVVQFVVHGIEWSVHFQTYYVAWLDLRID